MNIIYTWVNVNKESNSSKGWGDNFIDIAMISVSSANKYHHTKLYCDSISKDFFISNNIPIKEIIVLKELDDFDSPNWGFAKLISMKYETGKFLHIDFDTILTHKPEQKPFSIVYGFYEFNFGVRHTPYRELEYLYNNYIKNYIKYHKDELSKEKWDWSVIPNNCYMYVGDYDIIRDVIEKLYEFVKPIMNNTDDSLNQYIEQYLFYKILTDNKVRIDFQSDIDSPNVIQLSDKKLLLKNKNYIDKWLNTTAGFFHWPNYNQYTQDEIYPIYEKLWKIFNIKHKMVTIKNKTLI